MFVVALIAWRSLLEVIRMVLCLCAMRHKSVEKLAQWHVLDFARSSVFGPSLYLVGIDWWRDVLLHKLLWWEYLLRFVTQILISKLPQMACGIFYFFVVQQSGMSTTGYVSLGTSLSSMLFVLFQSLQLRHSQGKKRASGDLSADNAAGSVAQSVSDAVQMVMMASEAASVGTDMSTSSVTNSMPLVLGSDVDVHHPARLPVNPVVNPVFTVAGGEVPFVLASADLVVALV